MHSSPQTDSRSSPVFWEAEVDAFIGKSSDKDRGERVNYQLFMGERCELFGVPNPSPAENTYVFERQVEIAAAPIDRTQSCAAEEERGHIRWLRPEYQASNAATTQTEIAGTTPSEPVTKSKEPAPVQPWLKTPPDQIAAVRSALTITDDPINSVPVAKMSKGERRNRIDASPESLQALGYAKEVEDQSYPP